LNAARASTPGIIEDHFAAMRRPGRAAPVPDRTGKTPRGAGITERRTADASRETIICRPQMVQIACREDHRWTISGISAASAVRHPRMTRSPRRVSPC
jgi:hypothetical protein